MMFTQSDTERNSAFTSFRSQSKTLRSGDDPCVFLPFLYSVPTLSCINIIRQAGLLHIYCSINQSIKL